MIIGVDVDGVVADLHTEWLRRYNADYGDCLTPEGFRAWDVHRFVKPECGKRIYDYLHDADLYPHVDPVPGAAEGIYALQSFGHRVVYITSNVWGMSDQKWTWLEQWKFLPREATAPNLISATDKSLFAVDAMVDDYHENLRTSRATHRLLLSRPWNQGEEGPWRRVASWDCVCDYFNGLAA